jgi:tRNA(fMet)-specific endonuclease VapC
LQSLGTPIDPYDVQVAGVALSRNLTLVTRNTREFDRVPELRVENWHD